MTPTSNQRVTLLLAVGVWLWKLIKGTVTHGSN